MRARERKAVGHSVGQAHEGMPRRPAPQPLSGALEAEGRRANHATIAGHELESAHPARRSRPDRRPSASRRPRTSRRWRLAAADVSGPARPAASGPRAARHVSPVPPGVGIDHVQEHFAGVARPEALRPTTRGTATPAASGWLSLTNSPYPATAAQGGMWRRSTAVRIARPLQPRLLVGDERERQALLACGTSRSGRSGSARSRDRTARSSSAIRASAPRAATRRRAPGRSPAARSRRRACRPSTLHLIASPHLEGRRRTCGPCRCGGTASRRDSGRASASARRRSTSGPPRSFSRSAPGGIRNCGSLVVVAGVERCRASGSGRSPPCPRS